MSFNYNKLKGKIREVFGTQAELAIALGISKTSLNLKLNNHFEFSQNEIDKACNALGINKCDIPEYFFNLKVQKHEQ